MFYFYFILLLDEHILDYVLHRLSTCDKNSKAFFVVLSIISDKVDSRSIIKYLPSICETLIDLMTSNNSVSIFLDYCFSNYKIVY